VGDRIFIGIDLGTTHLKAGIYDTHLACLSSARLRMLEKQRGSWDGDDLWRTTQRLLKAVLDGTDSTRVAAVGISGMAEAGCLLDRRGDPTTPILLWHDRRGVRQAAAWRPEIEDHLRAISGQRMTSVRSLAKWRWLVDHGASGDDRWCGVPELVALRLTGEWRTEPTLATRTAAYNVVEGRYDGRMRDLAGAQEKIFPPVERAMDAAGELRPDVAKALDLPGGVIVTLAGHDDIVAAYGAGGEAGALVDSAGTGEALVRIFNPPPEAGETAAAGLSTTPFYTPGTWAVLKGAGATGALMAQVAATLDASPGDLDRIATPPGAYPEGALRARLSTHGLPTVRIANNVSDGAVWSAALDLVAERSAKAARKIGRVVGVAERLMVVGGGAKSAELCRRKGDLLELPVVRYPAIDATTRGAAALAALAASVQVAPSLTASRVRSNT
jgi:xylulokinase